MGRGGLRVNRYWIWKARQAEAQKELWTDEQGYYFCNIVTVLPGEQGRGIGRKLMQAAMDQADKEDRKCYLESSRLVPNVAIYEKMGFRLVREMRCDDGVEGEGCDVSDRLRKAEHGSALICLLISLIAVLHDSRSKPSALTTSTTEVGRSSKSPLYTAPPVWAGYRLRGRLVNTQCTQSQGRLVDCHVIVLTRPA